VLVVCKRNGIPRVADFWPCLSRFGDHITVSESYMIILVALLSS